MAYQIAQGNLTPAMILNLGVNGQPQSLATVTAIRLRWLKPNGVFTVQDLGLGSIVNATAGVVKKTWSGSETQVVGLHYGQIDTDTPDGLQSYPTDGTYFRWEVTAPLTATSDVDGD